MDPEKDPRPAAGDDVRFEETVARLEEIVERMEADALDLDEALALYEEGVRLLRAAQGVLDRSEARVLELRPDDGGFRLEPWEPS